VLDLVELVLVMTVNPGWGGQRYLSSMEPKIAEVRRMVDAAGRADAIERGPGRHGLSNAFFLYLRDGDGHRIELYTGDYYTGDPDFEPIRWSVNDPRRGTFWGHAAPTSWFEESAPVADLEGGTAETAEPRLGDRPQTVT
jgi:catechol 2,3-dioxygenase